MSKKVILLFLGSFLLFFACSTNESSGTPEVTPTPSPSPNGPDSDTKTAAWEFSIANSCSALAVSDGDSAEDIALGNWPAGYSKDGTNPNIITVSGNVTYAVNSETGKVMALRIAPLEAGVLCINTWTSHNFGMTVSSDGEQHTTTGITLSSEDGEVLLETAGITKISGSSKTTLNYLLSEGKTYITVTGATPLLVYYLYQGDD